MAIGDQVGKDAVDELTQKTVPELIAGANAVADRFSALLDRLDGATVTITVKLGHK